MIINLNLFKLDFIKIQVFITLIKIHYEKHTT
jgi:hypothetical protein